MQTDQQQRDDEGRLAPDPIDHRGLEFSRLASEVPENLRPVFQTTAPVIVYPASGAT